MLDGNDAATARTVALGPTPTEVFASAVRVSSELLDVDLTFAALPEDRYMRVAFSSGAQDPRFHDMRVTPGRGLGGQVLALGRPMRVDDYAHDPRITDDFVDIVTGGEGLHGMICIPLRSPTDEIEGLLYAARHSIGGMGDQAVEVLREIASYAQIGLDSAAARGRALQEERRSEREHIATELHDTVAQALFSIATTARRCTVDPNAEREALLHGLAHIAEVVDDARLSLRQTLQRTADAVERPVFDVRLADPIRRHEHVTGCAVRLIWRGAGKPMSSTVEDLVVDVVAEGLRNAAKHQGAASAAVVLQQGARDVLVVVHSERGPQLEDRPWGTGLGLQLLEHRARRLHGTLQLTLNDDGGAALRLRVPTLVVA